MASDGEAAYHHQCHETNLQFLSYAAIQAVIIHLRSLEKGTGEPLRGFLPPL